MAFTIPQFNLIVGLFTMPAFVFRGIGKGNLSVGRRTQQINASGTLAIGPPGYTMTLLMQKGTDVRSSVTGAPGDVVEVPTGSGRFYDVLYVDDIGKGFSNEHRFAILAPHPGIAWPIPIP